MVNIALSMENDFEQLALTPIAEHADGDAADRLGRRKTPGRRRQTAPTPGAGSAEAIDLPQLLSVSDVASRYRCSREEASKIMRACGAFVPARALLVRSDRLDAWERSSARGRFQRPEVERGGTASLLTVAEVALRCACSRKTIYRAIGRGDLGATRLGSQLRVSHASLAVWVASQRRTADATPAQLAPAPSAGNAGRIRSLLMVQAKT